MNLESPGLLALILGGIILISSWFAPSASKPIAEAPAALAQTDGKTTLTLTFQPAADAKPLDATGTMDLTGETTRILRERFGPRYAQVVVIARTAIGAAPGTLPTMLVQLAGTPPVAELRDLATARGDMLTALVADETWAKSVDVDLADERARFDAWRAENGKLPASRFHDVPRANGGAHGDLAWFPVMLAHDSEMPRAASDADRWVPTLVKDGSCLRFVRDDFIAFERTADRSGRACIRFELKAEQDEALAELTTGAIGRRLALVCSGKVLTSPTINDPLRGGGIIAASQMSEQDVNRIVAAASMEPLPVPLTLVSIERKPE